MIDISKLRKKDIGRFVEYRSSGYENEKGRIKSWNDKYIFVVYKCDNQWNRFQDFTSVATLPELLYFIEKKK